MMAQFLSLPACWGKTAQTSDGGHVSERSQGIVFKEIVSSLKTAGMNPFEIQGFFIGLTEALPLAMPKTAAPTAVTPAPVNMGDINSMGSTLTPVNPAPPVAQPAAPAAPADTPAAPAAPLLDLGGSGGFKNIANKVLTHTPAGFAYNKLVGHDMTVDNVANDFTLATRDKNSPAYQNAAKETILSGAKEKHPTGYGFAEALFPDEMQRADFLNQLRQGNWAKAIGQGGQALMANPTVKEWSKYVVPAAATMAATRLAGGTWGQGALLGAGAGAAYGGYLAPNGGVVKGVKKLFSDHPFDDGTSPAASAAIGDSKAPTAGANQIQQTEAEKIQQSNNQLASDILKTNPAQ